jgi:tetratricopeptide (TPR) repeat protein
MKLLRYLTFTLLLLFFSMMAKAQEDELDVLELASLLIKNQNYTRAASVLASVEDPDDVQTDRYYTLLGVLNLRQGRIEESIKNLQLAEKSGIETKDQLEFQETFARALLQGKRYQQAEAVLTKRKNLIETRPLYFQLLSKLNFETKRSEKGWSVLHSGLKKFPAHMPLMKQKWFYLFDNGLLKTSSDYLFSIIDHHPMPALDLAKMAYQYRLKKDLKTASVIVELARMKDSSHEEIAKEAARIHVESGNLLAAAQIFENLAIQNPKYYPEASELWRKAGSIKTAERLAYMIRDEDKALTQKITLALEGQDFNRIAGLGKQILRSELKTNEDILYTMAYSHFMLGEFKQVELFLKNITRPDLFKKALTLRETMTECGEKIGGCL